MNKLNKARADRERSARAFYLLSVAAAADNEERDENDPDPVVVEKRAKAAGVASTVRVHKKFLSAAGRRKN